LELILVPLAIYLACGMVFAAGFITVGLARVDHTAHGAPWGFRLLILPGAVALWPVLAIKWVRAAARERHA
jgi:hypothetical protein